MSAAMLSSVPSVAADLALAPVQSPQVWYGPDLAKRPEEWTHALSPAEVAELRASIAAVEARGLDVVDIRARDFPLLLLGPVQHLREELLHGRGFGVLRGFPVDGATPRQRAIGFFGIGAHLGEAVLQTARGHALGHVAEFVCNHYIFHSRTTFEDDPEPTRRRHLLRLWLACEEGPALPPVFDNYTGLDGRGRPMGLLLEGVRLNAPLEPEDGGPGESVQRRSAAAP